jgi:hypothetical protein
MIPDIGVGGWNKDGTYRTEICFYSRNQALRAKDGFFAGGCDSSQINEFKNPRSSM